MGITIGAMSARHAPRDEPALASVPENAPETPPAQGGGVRVARLFGVPIYVEPRWLLVAFVLLTLVVQPQIPEHFPLASTYLIALCFAPLLYLSVLIHELGHSVVALRFGLKVERIRLHLLGGVSEIASEAPTPRQEFAIAAAGPALSLALFGLGWGLVMVLPGGTVLIYIVMLMAQANLVVAIFNLLPGLPLDGGRVLQAAVWAGTGNRFRGVVVAAWTGLVLAGLLLVVAPLIWLGTGAQGWISLVWGVTIAIFLFSGAQQSLRIAKFRRRIGPLWARPLSRRALLVPTATTIAEALRRQVITRASAIVVIDEAGQPVGIVSPAAAQATPPDRRVHVRAGELMHTLTPAQFLSADTTGEALLQAMHSGSAGEYVVRDEATGAVIGVLHTDDVLRLVH